jgi:hypothetical protein
VADVFLDRLQRAHQLVGDLVRRARGQQRQHLQLPAGQQLGQARRRHLGGRLHLGRDGAGIVGPECRLEAA